MLDESRYIDAATYLVTCNAQPYSRYDWHWRVLVAHHFGHAAAAPTVHGTLKLLDDSKFVYVSPLKKDGAEICAGVLSAPDFTNFWKQCAQQGYQPKILTISKALLFHQTIEAVGDIGIGCSDHMVWHPKFPYKSYLTGQTCEEYAAQYTADTGKQWGQPLGQLQRLHGGIEPRLRAQVVQAATKWKRMALRQFGMDPGEGLLTDMRAVRKDYFLDHDHSAYVDQWDWEKVMVREERDRDDDVVEAVLLEQHDDVLHHRPVGDGHHRLRLVAGERAQPGALTAGEDHCLHAASVLPARPSRRASFAIGM